MISVCVKRNRGKEWMDPDALEQTRLGWGNALQALVVDLDKCLIRGYAGVPAFKRLIRSGDAKWRDAASYISLALRHRISHSQFKRRIPASFTLNSRQFQEQSLLFELKSEEKNLREAVRQSLPELAALVRQPLLNLCVQAAQGGAELILATANSATFAEPLAESLGFHTVLASRLDRIQKQPVSLLVGEDKRNAVLNHLNVRSIPLSRSWLIVDLDYSGNDQSLIDAFGHRVSLVTKGK